MASTVPEQWLDAFAQRLEERLRSGGLADKDALHAWKQATARTLGAPRIPRDPDLLARLPDDLRTAWAPLLRKKPMRTQSGVAIVAVMSSPAACPHGKCVYCPGGPDVDAPQSYTGFEPSTMRAKRLDYDPYRVVRTRLGRLEANGHAVDKVDLVIQGGTFPARDAAYRDWFIAMAYAGLNAGPSLDDPGALEDEATWRAMDAHERADRIAALQRQNETARCRCIGLTIETKPDWCMEPHVDAMLAYGATRIELGIQTLDEEVTRLTNRGHTVQDTRDAMRIARDAGFKLCAHMMPGLPRPDPDHPGAYRTDEAADVEDLRRLFAEPDWRPDMLKVYPTLVVQEGETPLKRWWKEGRYTPLDTDAAARVVAEGLNHVPAWCRVQRVDRDIPTTHVVAGVQNSNLRQIAAAEAERQGLEWQEIRTREAGTRIRAGAIPDAERAVLHCTTYRAGGGDEAFFAFEDPQTDALLGFLRLRRVGTPHRKELQHPDGVAVVRELKVFGTALPIGQDDDGATPTAQHHGLGTRLLRAAEDLAFGTWEVARTAVLAGPGVKPYYRRHGYQDLGPYVAKERP